MKNKHKPYGPYEKWFKRPMDFICALLALIVLSPIMLIAAILVRTKLGSPVIFTQECSGLNERIFKLYKCRSMIDARDENGELLQDDVRLTKIGRRLRKTSLEGNDKIRQTTKSLKNKGFREVSLIIFFTGCNQFSNDSRVMIA